MKNKLIPVIVSCAVIVVLIVAGGACTLKINKKSDSNEAGVNLTNSRIKTSHI